MDQEDAFAQEARDRPLLETDDHDTKPDIHFRASEEVDENESSPLIGSRSGRPERTVYSRAGESYQKAINEPWTGAYGAGPLPWYKRPSVSRMDATSAEC